MIHKYFQAVSKAVIDGQRTGQAMMNCLPTEMYEHVTGTDIDVFYMTNRNDDPMKWDSFVHYVTENYGKI